MQCQTSKHIVYDLLRPSEAYKRVLGCLHLLSGFVPVQDVHMSAGLHNIAGAAESTQF